MSESNNNLRLEIIGDGPLRREAEVEARRLGLAERVVFHGAQPHEFVAARLREAALLIQHCVSLPNGGIESFGLSLLEAMSCALPVVSTRHGAIPEIVQDGVTGLLVDENDVEGMGAAMAKLVLDPDCATAMGAAGRARVIAHFTQEKARDRMRAIMELPPLAMDTRAQGAHPLQMPNAGARLTSNFAD